MTEYPHPASPTLSEERHKARSAIVSGTFGILVFTRPNPEARLAVADKIEQLYATSTRDTHLDTLPKREVHNDGSESVTIIDMEQITPGKFAMVGYDAARVAAVNETIRTRSQTIPRYGEVIDGIESILEAEEPALHRYYEAVTPERDQRELIIDNEVVVDVTHDLSRALSSYERILELNE